MSELDDASTVPVSPQPRKPPERIGRYELRSRIGKGGMGVVYKARDTRLQRDVALKMLLTDVADVEETRERFIREARAAADLRHRNIIQVYDFGEENGRAFFVMELLSGDSLAAELKRGEPLPLDRAIRIMTEICDGLAFAHSKSIVHRDLKPANLFVTADGTMKILDFGLARIASSKLTRSGLVFGTPDYMSPEQVRGKVADHRSDIFSAGAVFYQILSGKKPFAAGSLPMVMRKVVEADPARLTAVPPALARVITKALQKDPAERYQSVDALVADLRAVGAAPAAEQEASLPVEKIGRYEILERVGRGGMGVVYRARDPVLDRDVAIKSIPGDFTADEVTAGQFEREARAAARLQHPNIITIYELGEADGSPYIVMEFLGGTDLEGLMWRDPPLSLGDKVRLMTQLCAGLSFAHTQGIVHRDIKPSNVRVLDDGTVKLLDFGIAKVSRADPTFSDLAGSVEYMSPEQLHGGAVDVRTDVFAVGALMYELFGGAKPFKGDTPAAIAYQILHEEPAPLRAMLPDAPEALEEVVKRALEKEPAKRFGSADELVAALRLVYETSLAKRAPRRGAGELRLTTSVPTDVANPALDVRMARTVDVTAPAKSLPRRSPQKTIGLTLAAAAFVAAAGLGSYAVVSRVGLELPQVDGVTLPRSPGPGPVLALSISSEPQGARILFDGEDVELIDGERVQQTTPASVPFRGGFPQVVRLTRSGFQLTEIEVPAAVGNTLMLTAPLGSPVPTGVVALSGPYPFEVWQGNRRLRNQATEHTLELQAGSIALQVRNADFFLDQRVALEVIDGQRREVPVSAPGSLTVFSRPGNCEIVIDGQNVGFPPISGRTVAAGRHTVARECPDEAQNTSQQIPVASGEPGRVTFTPQ